MAGIDDLKQNNDIVIDATNPETTTTNAKVVSLGAPKGKTIVRSNSTANKSAARTNVDLSTLPKDTTFDEGIVKGSPVNEILEGEGSIFETYMQEKKKEMEQWSEEKEAEKELDDIDQELELASTPVSDLDVIASEAAVAEDNITITTGNFAVVNDDIDFDSESEEDDEEENDALSEGIKEDIPEEEINKVESVPEKKVEEEPKRIDTSDITLDENDSTKADIMILDEDEETEEANENDEDEVIKHLQQLATEKLKPVSQHLDISSFTVLKKPTSNTKFLQQQQVKVAKWVLPNQESIVQMKEYLGSELEQLREYSEDATSITSLTRKFRSIYDHITSPKPSTYEAWLKSTPYTDIDHYFFAIYIACFKGANYIPADCPNDKCKETFLTDDIPIMDMVKFESEESKAKFQKIYQNETALANKNGLYTTEVVPLSNNIAVAFKEPSIYALMEIASLDDRFKEKYASIIDYIPFIDSLYIIDIANQSLEPIGYKGFADNATKTIKSKIQKFDTVLKSLSIDEFGPIKSYIRAIRERKSDFSYVFPAVTCPKCGTSTTEASISAEEMVFTRYQLGNLVNTSLK